MPEPRRPSALGGDSLTPVHTPGSSPVKRPGGRRDAGRGLQGRGERPEARASLQREAALHGLPSPAEQSLPGGGLTLAGGLLRGHWGPALPPPRVHTGRVLPGSLLHPQLSLGGGRAGQGAHYAEGGGLGGAARTLQWPPPGLGGPGCPYAVLAQGRMFWAQKQPGASGWVALRPVRAALSLLLRTRSLCLRLGEEHRASVPAALRSEFGGLHLEVYEGV